MRGSLIGSFVQKINRADASGVLRMLEDMGQDAIMSALGGASSPLGIGLNAFLKYTKALDRESVRLGRQKEKPLSATQKRLNAARHQKWLEDNRWRFDWRSQPRRPAGTDAGGEWMDGRLDHPVAPKPRFSRSITRRRTRAMREYKARQVALGQTKTRTIRSAWGDF